MWSWENNGFFGPKVKMSNYSGSLQPGKIEVNSYSDNTSYDILFTSRSVLNVLNATLYCFLKWNVFHHTIKKVMLRNIKKFWHAFYKTGFLKEKSSYWNSENDGRCQKGTPIVRIIPRTVFKIESCCRSIKHTSKMCLLQSTLDLF